LVLKKLIKILQLKYFFNDINSFNSSKNELLGKRFRLTNRITQSNKEMLEQDIREHKELQKGTQTIHLSENEHLKSIELLPQLHPVK